MNTLELHAKPENEMPNTESLDFIVVNTRTGNACAAFRLPKDAWLYVQWRRTCEGPNGPGYDVMSADRSPTSAQLAAHVKARNEIGAQERTTDEQTPPADAGPVDRTVRPLAECKPEDLLDRHAFVYGRIRIWLRHLTDLAEGRFLWSKVAWWKGMWYPHRGGAHLTTSWGVYGGCEGCFTGPGDAELTHFMPIPDAPEAER